MPRNDHWGQVADFSIAGTASGLGAMVGDMRIRLVWPHRRDLERGATMLEYALLATLIAMVVSTALVAFGPAVSALFVGATDGL